MTDAALLNYLRSEPDVRAQFISFARQVLEVHDRGYFPDLLGPGDLLVVNHGARPCLRLIDYGVFDLRVRLQESSTSHRALLWEFWQARSASQTIVGST